MNIQDIDRQLAEKYAYQKIVDDNIPHTVGYGSEAKQAINANYAKSNAISTKRNNEEIQALLILRDNLLNPKVIQVIPEVIITPITETNEFVTPENIIPEIQIIQTKEENKSLLLPLLVIGGVFLL